MIKSRPVRLSATVEKALVLCLFRPALLLALTLGTAAATADTSSIAAFSVNDKLQHLAAFAVLGFLADHSLPDVRGGYWRGIVPFLLFYGAAIELVQAFLPYRSADLLDFAADFAGLLVYAALRPSIRRIWQPASLRK